LRPSDAALTADDLRVGLHGAEGCTFSFGPDLVSLRQRTGEYVARISKGADPADLSIEEPDRFTLTINRRGAAQLGLGLAPALVARTDDVVE
jgi:putative ABC transport system substrate-binding protein